MFAIVFLRLYELKFIVEIDLPVVLVFVAVAARLT